MIISVLPLWYQLMLVAVLGAVMASFINVVVYRFHTNASMGGRSHCFSCGKTLSWYELLPILSYLFLRGRCKGCVARISPKDFYIEVILAATFVLLYLVSSDLWQFATFAILTVLLAAVVLYDLMHLIIPNEFVVALAGFAVVVRMVTWWVDKDWWVLLMSLAAALAAFISYGSLWYFSGGRWIGFGDAKLAAALSLLLTPFAVFSLVVLSFWIGALVACLILLFQFLYRLYTRRYTLSIMENKSGYLTMKSEIPFAPFLVLAFASVYFFAANVLNLIDYVLQAIF